MTNSTEEIREYLIHSMGDGEAIFFEKIDLTGGWPLKYKYVSFYHSSYRYCKFTNHYLRTGWWTTMYNRDEYFWWKLSSVFKKKKKKAFISDYVQKLYYDANRSDYDE